MPEYRTYSERKREAERSESDVYEYEEIPGPLRKQVKRIFKRVMGDDTQYQEVRERWSSLRGRIALSLGRDRLAETSDILAHTSNPTNNPLRDCEMFLDREQNVENWLDLVELGALMIDKNTLAGSEEALEDLNYYFRLAGFGYQYESGQIIRVDNQFIHAEVVKPALHLLSDQRFKGAEKEFLQAHKHYRSGESKDCIVNAGKAFESTLKIICDLKKWKYEENAVASDLIKKVFNKSLLPDYLRESFSPLVQILKSGLPKIRNQDGGHGQGSEVRQPPTDLAAYALHLAAVNIRLLVEALHEHDATPSGS